MTQLNGSWRRAAAGEAPDPLSSPRSTGPPDGSGIRESTALEAERSARGPYVWERSSRNGWPSARQELGIEVKIVRPGAIIDRRAFDPPDGWAGGSETSSRWARRSARTGTTRGVHAA
jgi:hypothetical protein